MVIGSPRFNSAFPPKPITIGACGRSDIIDMSDDMVEESSMAPILFVVVADVVVINVMWIFLFVVSGCVVVQGSKDDIYCDL